MKKRYNIIYWVATIWLALGMLSTGTVQIIRHKDEVIKITHLGYPVYFLMILGIWKIMGVIAVLIPNIPIVKEWAYAGFFFAMSGALISHLSMGNPIKEILPSLLLLILTIVSWFFRPSNRKFCLDANRTI